MKTAVNVVCGKCHAEFVIDGAATERPVDVHGEPGVVEAGVACPQCGEWLHAYFDTAAMRRRRVSLSMAVVMFQKVRSEANLKKARRAQRKYKETFDMEQARLRPLFGALSPTAVLGQEVTDIPKDGEE